ncbi:MAG: glycine/sarcosine/betaine reductase selenoprotein B family protein [Gemmatimonadaceae bacterium]
MASSEMEGEQSTQLRPGLWNTVNERYPGSMIRRQESVPLARLTKPLSECRLGFVSSSGTQLRDTLPFDVAHPVGDYTIRRVPSNASPADLEIHQLKYPTDGARRDINVIFPIERLQELAAEGVVGSLANEFLTFIGYNMDPPLFESTIVTEIADALEDAAVDILLAAPA